MKEFKQHTVEDYLTALAQKKPTPGGGSAAALVAASAVALIAMVAEYSKGKSSSKAVESRMEKIIAQTAKSRQRLVELIDLDAQAYLQVVRVRKGSESEKKHAQLAAQGVSLEICQLCYQAVEMIPFLVQKGNQNLLSDVEVAGELLLAGFNSALIIAHA